jgi:hypothetical protein
VIALVASAARNLIKKEKKRARRLAGHDLAVAELDEGERNGVEEEHCAYDAADGPSQ